MMGKRMYCCWML